MRKKFFHISLIVLLKSAEVCLFRSHKLLSDVLTSINMVGLASINKLTHTRHPQ